MLRSAAIKNEQHHSNTLHAKSHVSLPQNRGTEKALPIISESVKYVKHMTEPAEAMLTMGFTTFQPISYLSVSTSALEKE
mmetsp:Transcript_23325/g.42299  ORF Transcript_23325/g.42299 Transcript_23325/m.42299 type:complete len:80 (-) Transcript_23325:343-582(-)